MIILHKFHLPMCCYLESNPNCSLICRYGVDQNPLNILRPWSWVQTFLRVNLFLLLVLFFSIVVLFFFRLVIFDCTFCILLPALSSLCVFYFCQCCLSAFITLFFLLHSCNFSWFIFIMWEYMNNEQVYMSSMLYWCSFDCKVIEDKRNSIYKTRTLYHKIIICNYNR